MKRPTFYRITLIVFLLFIGVNSYSQSVPFSSDNGFDEDVKGDILLIGNNILGPNNDPFNDNSVYNHNVDMQYIDIDGDPLTFSSSSADLEVPNPNCYEIIYAALYWGAVEAGSAPSGTVKFKGPSGDYNDITGTVIYDQPTTPVGQSFPYAYYSEVTDIVTGLATQLGTYTVANVSSAEGETGTFDPFNGTGLSAGWSLFVVYEDPTLPGKSITSFNGFEVIRNATGNVDVDVVGFRTIPTGPVRANFAFATLEGDSPITGDRLRINGTSLFTADRPVDNFFNSSVTQLSALPVDNREPNSTNTLGFDTGVIAVPNPGNGVINNGDTSAVVTLETSGDTYFQYFFALAVEIIEPNIPLTKIVVDNLGVDVGGQTVGLGQPLNYIIGFQNTGNDDATNFTIRDILPINIVFNPTTDLVLPPGVTMLSYDPVTREIIFSIENYLVEQGDPVYEIRIETEVVQTCSLLADACSNIINNQAYATYQGTDNPDFIISDDPSFSTNTGCLLTPQATNFLADLDDCVFSQNEILCGDSIELTAANGYDTYEWYTNPAGTGTPISTDQTITVTSTGTYYVFNTAIAPCQSIVQNFVVTTFGGNITNPVIPFADEVVTCPNDGEELPNIFLCGANDFRDILTNITGASSIIWEQLDEVSCPAVVNQDCANTDNTCTWNQVGTGPNYTANTAGQFRLTINFAGGCFDQFYFNVYQNLLAPTVTATDIICTTPGSITVNNVPAGYEYSLDAVNYQPSNVFSITTPGFYTVYIRQIGVATNPCIFTVPDIQIRERDFNVSTIITQPLCHGERGNIQLAANDVEPQYTFSLFNGGTLVNSSGLIIDNNYTFANLNPGTYTATVETEDGCFYTEDFTIVEPPLLTATAAITRPLTCEDGEITVYPVGGTPPYFYFVNTTPPDGLFQGEQEIVVTTPGTYDIIVVDTNNCSTEVSITIDATLPPEYNITTTDILCSDSGDSGTITVNVTNANGNTLEYSIDGGTTFFNSPVFTGLATGDYDVVVQYTTGPSVCTTDPQTVSITANPAISGTAALTALYTCTTTGTIIVTGVTGGDGNYTYSIDGVTFQTSDTFTGLTDGTYTITVQDGNDCTFISNQITIAPLDPPTDLMFSNTPLTCPSNLSDVTITATTGGVTPLEYQIIAPVADATAYQASNVFTGLAPGTYTFQVNDANDCTYSESYTIDPLPVLSVVGQNINDITCFGDSDGSIQFTVSGSTGFTYTINAGTSTPGTSPIVLTGLAAGTYTIVVTDTTTNCDATAALTVNEPPAALAITTTMTPITCIENGSVVINTTGGWGGNMYSLTLPDSSILGPQSSDTFVNLSQDGLYTVTVVDTNGCTVTDTFNLSTPSIPVASISTTSDFCFDATNSATLEVTASGGVAPYQYNINAGAFQDSNIFDNLTPGTYTIIVRDAFGCEVTVSTQTIEPQLTLSTVLTKDLDCTASPDAIITGTITGGTAPFTHAVSINGATYTPLGTTGSPFIYTTPTDGTYQFQVTDALGCTAESAVQTINPISLPEIISVTQTQPILCNGDSNAAIDIVINTTVGTPAFVINVNNDTTGVDYGTQTSGLPAGTYTITLTDSKSCEDTETITINEPDPIVVNYTVVDITCTATGVSQGSIIIDSVTGGTPDYNYLVTSVPAGLYSNSEINTTGSTSVSFNVVDFGLYQINVVDANGCSVLIQDVLVASPPSDLDINVNTIVDCLTGGEAVVSVSSALASSGPFYFAIYPGFIPPPPPGAPWVLEASPGVSQPFTGLLPDVTYTFIVYDTATNCSYYETATPVPTNSTLTATAVDANNITCTGNADGNVTFTINNSYGIPLDVDYTIYDSVAATPIVPATGGSVTIPAGGSQTITNLGPLPLGSYFVLIEETSGPNAGCSITTAPFNITESVIPLDLSTSVDQNANCNANSGVISAIGSNGTAPYLYQITTTPAAPLATDPAWASDNTFNMDAGNYYVHVIDAYGCIVSSPVVVLPMDSSPVIAATLNNQCTAVEGAFEIDVTLSTAGIAPYSVSIDGGAFQTQTIPFTISNLSSGMHTVEVQDANGCGNLVSIDILTPVALTPTVTALPSCTNDDGEITVSGIGGSGTYTYSITPNTGITLTGNVFSGVPSGTYTVTITDTITTCTSDATITLDAATPVTFTTTATDTSCNGDSDGTITVNLPPSNDNPVYTYEIIAPIVVPAQNSNVFTGLPADTYTVQVNSGRGCFEVADVTIGEPVLLGVSATATDFACAADNTVNTAIVTITETGGTGTYTYSINGNDYFSNNTFEIIDTGNIQTIDVYVQDANGCSATNTVTINPLPTITIAAVAIATPIDCNNTGTIEINVTGGSGNFTYQMLPSGTPQASNIFTVTAPGDYYFQVNDTDTSCTFATTVFTVPPFDTIEAIATEATAVSCFGDSSGEIELTINDYTGNYTYEVLDNSGVSVGGVINANTSTNPQIITGLSGGNYTVVVIETDSPFCNTTTNVVTITSPPSPLTLTATETSNVTCDNNLGTITAVGDGGTGTYEYELTGDATEPYSTNGSFTGLAAGTYTINVRDDAGCITSASVILAVPPPITATFTANTTLLPCFGDQSATITVTAVTGGQGNNYTYTLNSLAPGISNSGPQTSPVFTDLGAGSYSITITDGFNCILTSTLIDIAEPTPTQASLVAATTPTCTTNATLTLSASDGTGPYTYSNNPNMIPVLGSFATDTTFSVPVGTYEYYVMDANGCIANVSNEITVEPVPDLLINLDSMNPTISCNGANTGVITATAQGGLGNYVYTLLDASLNPINTATQNSPGVFTELVAGTYVVNVDSGDCQFATGQIVIDQPPLPLQAAIDFTDITCAGANNGTLQIINVSGGTGIIRYSISPQSDQFFDIDYITENLGAGTYNVIVVDEAGCFLEFDFTITEPSVVLLIPSSTDETCSGENDGAISGVISGGEQPYSVSLDDYNGVYEVLVGDTFDFTGIAGGEHIVYVRDNLGCESEWLIALEDSIIINPVVVVEYTCENNMPGNIVTVSVDDSITDLSDLLFSLDNNPPQQPGNNIFVNVPPGNHFIIVEQISGGGCIQTTQPFDIADPLPLTLSVSEGGLNEIVATAGGGLAPYTYTFNGVDNGTDNTYIISQSGVYTVIVTDSRGCTAMDSIEMEFIDLCIPSYFTPNNDGVVDGWTPGCSINYPDLDFDIFDRYGRKVATLAQGEYWYGKYNDKELPTGDYWYVVRLNTPENDRSFVGHFTLYR